ncbi:cupin domain-containing protein [Candidatus Woesearchaeota archaeon]|nr:cupin domain-containing protein [Candidatus Woesearchaeota archaeon]
MTVKINLSDKVKALNGRPWQPVEVASVNDQAVRLALFRGEYHWHNHSNEDELIFVYKGKIVVQFKDRPNVELTAGELTVIPKGVEHCPKSLEDSYVLMFEPLSLKSKGD